MTTTPTTDPRDTANDVPLTPGAWMLDPAHSAVGFTIRHLGVSKVRGRFGKFDANVHVGETLDSSGIDAVVELDSVDTGNSDRDTHLRSADLLHVERRPTMTFRSTGISGAGRDWRLIGDLTIGEVSGPLELEVEFGGLEEFPGGARHAGFEARGELRRSDFGLDFALPAGTAKLLGDVVKIEIDVQFVEPQPNA
jgi:polyisoprenoid-binding protein YceI